MTPKSIIYPLIFILVFINTQSLGQGIDDWEARPMIFVKHKFKNGIALEAKYEHRLDQNFSHYKKSVVGLEMGYKIGLNNVFSLEPGLDYRFNFGNNKTSHDFRYFLALGYEISKQFSLEYKPTFQQVLSSGNSPENFLRNELELTYDINNWSIFVFTENYQLIKKGLHFDTQKYGIGTEYQFNEKNALEFKFDIKHRSDNKNIARILFGYIFIIP